MLVRTQSLYPLEYFLQLPRLYVVTKSMAYYSSCTDYSVSDDSSQSIGLSVLSVGDERRQQDRNINVQSFFSSTVFMFLYHYLS